jgi:hypothetical protein
MSLAQRISPMDDVQEVSNEARERLSSARHRDIAFAVKRRIGDRFSADDVEMLVTIVVEAVADRKPLSQPLIVKCLRDYGRSPQKSEELAAALLQ